MKVAFRGTRANRRQIFDFHRGREETPAEFPRHPTKRIVEQEQGIRRIRRELSLNGILLRSFLLYLVFVCCYLLLSPSVSREI